MIVAHVSVKSDRLTLSEERHKKDLPPYSDEVYGALRALVNDSIIGDQPLPEDRAELPWWKDIKFVTSLESIAAIGVPFEVERVIINHKKPEILSVVHEAQDQRLPIAATILCGILAGDKMDLVDLSSREAAAMALDLADELLAVASEVSLSKTGDDVTRHPESELL